MTATRSAARGAAAGLAVLAVGLLVTGAGPQGRILVMLGRHHGVHLGDLFALSLLAMSPSLWWRAA
jgi:hypothetical protein